METEWLSWTRGTPAITRYIGGSFINSSYFFKGALFARFKCSSESVFKHWILTKIGESYQHKRHNFILFFLIFFQWDLNLVKYQNLRHIQDIILPDFFFYGISKFNEENRKKYLFVRILHKITWLYMLTSKKYFQIFLNKCACKWEFHLILFL